MRFLRSWRSRVRWLFRRSEIEAELQDELHDYIERQTERHRSDGLSPEASRLAALREAGGIEQVKEECRDVRSRWLEDFGKDLRYTVRSLRRSPGFLAVSVLSLALGIGANTAIFSLINALMLRSLPVKNPQSLVHITRVDSDGKPQSVSWPLFQYFRDNLKSISSAAAERSEHPTIFIDGRDEVVSADLVSGDQYRMLGIEPAAGRLLEPADGKVATSPSAVISYGYWRRRFGLNPAAIGKTFTVQDHVNVFTIVGVTPPWYHGVVLGSDPDVSVPVATMLSEEERNEPTYNNLNMMGRLAPGVTHQHANAELQVLWHAFKQRVAATLPEQDRPGYLQERAAMLSGSSGFNPLRDKYSEALLVLMGIVALVLLLACANLSGLLLARAAARQREISIRLAIGAGRGRLIRQFLTEGFVLAALGGSVGLLLARLFATALVTTMANGEAVTLSVAPDWHVLTFTVALSLLVCVVAGLAPGLYGLRTDLNLGIRQQRNTGHQRLGRALVIAQVSISMVLVTGAVLFAATLLKLYSVDRGLNTEGVLTFSLRISGKCPPARCRAAAQSLLDRLNRLPGVASASAVDVLPISGSLWDRDVQVEGYSFRSGEDQGTAFNAIAPKYFSTVQTPLLQGREFNSRDTRTSRKVTIVNQSFARYFFGAASPLGRTVTSVKVSYEIVGLVADAKYTNLKQPLMKTMYIPWTQRMEEEPTDFNFLMRVTGGDPMRLIPTLERIVRETDPALRIGTTAAWSTVASRTIVSERMMAALGGFFGLLALVVACVGTFGVMAFRVSQRVNEIGVRIALGASRIGIMGMVLWETATMLLAGCLIGVAGTLSLGRLTRSMLFDVSPADPGLFILAATVLVITGLTAGWLPAQRAARVDPMTALRSE